MINYKFNIVFLSISAFDFKYIKFIKIVGCHIFTNYMMVIYYIICKQYQLFD